MDVGGGSGDPFAWRNRPMGRGKVVRRSRLGLCASAFPPVAESSSGARLVEMPSDADIVGVDIPQSCADKLLRPVFDINGQFAKKKKRGRAHLSTVEASTSGCVAIEGSVHRRKSRRIRCIESMSEGESTSGDDGQCFAERPSVQRKRKVAPDDLKKRRKSRKISKRKKTTRTPAAAVNSSLPTDRLLLGAPSYCHHCYARKFSSESEYFCCAKGEVKLAVNRFPPELRDLYVREDDLGDHFRQYSRMYNNMFAYSSLGGNIDAGAQKGIYNFKLHGQIYHFVPELLPGERGPNTCSFIFMTGSLKR